MSFALGLAVVMGAVGAYCGVRALRRVNEVLSILRRKHYRIVSIEMDGQITVVQEYESNLQRPSFREPSGPGGIPGEDGPSGPG